MIVATGAWSSARGWEPRLAELTAGALDGGARTLVIAFGDSSLRLDPAPFAELQAALPAAVVVGCSTAGQILDGVVSAAPLVVAVVHFDDVRPLSSWASLTVEGSTALGMNLGRAIADQLADGAGGTVLVLVDGLAVNGTELVAAVRAQLPQRIAICGGLAGDGSQFEHTWVYADGQIRELSAVAVALCGDSLEVGYGSAGGWEAFGPYRQVTRSQGNVLHQLDGHPALALYKEYLGDRAVELPASALLFPLWIRSPDGAIELVRTILRVDETTSTMTFAGDIPQGWTARLMRTTLDRLIDAAEVAAEDAVDGLEDPQFTIAISCVGRRLVLGQRCDEEIEAATTALGANGSMIGFYSYGEISPFLGHSELHNQTMTVTTFREVSAG